MKKIIISALLLVGLLSASYAQENILEAREMPIGSVVTVTGIATNGSELGIIRYMQDETAGIAAYGSAVGDVNRGDSISVTGTLKIYNQLLEIDPVTNVEILSTGNTLPDPVLLTPDQINESYEAQLIKVVNAVFNDGGQIFTGNSKYAFTSNGEVGYTYIKNGQDIVGTIIPSAPVELTGLCSQFDFSNPYEGYQMVLRDLDDIYIPSSIYFVDVLTNTEFTQNSMDFEWNTNIEGTTEMYYGPTQELVEENNIYSGGQNTNHSLGITDLNPGEITWVQAFSVSGTDTAKSAVVPFATISNSSGNMIAYFNSEVDVSYSTGIDAIFLHETMDDTLISYIERAKYTIDFTIYNFNNMGLSNISDALIAAADRGVRVRVIGCGTTANLGIDELIGTNVHVLIAPDDYNRDGIMHNKFIVFDAQSDNPDEPLVWTGSTNLTDGQVNLDANNVIIVQDQSLALTYQIEFEEMWGSHGDEPDAGNARFGEEKMNNTPHEFVIDGKRVECYFSPSDGVNSKIVDVINTADNDLSVGTMLITRTTMADAIVERKSAGVAVNVITNAKGNNNSTVNELLEASLTTHVTYDDVAYGILHHKYMIVDQGNPSSDPIVFTGSHNWSASADNINDENTLVIHDATLANIYYQQFVYRFVENHGVLYELTDPPVAVDDNVETNINTMVPVMVLENDILESPVSLAIETNATQGNAYIPFTNPNVINYQPNDGFYGTDSITYKVVYNANSTLFASAKVYFTVIDNSGVDELFFGGINIYPNPADNYLNVSFTSLDNTEVEISMTDISGRIVLRENSSISTGYNKIDIDLNSFNAGIYFLKISEGSSSVDFKVVVK